MWRRWRTDVSPNGQKCGCWFAGALKEALVPVSEKAFYLRKPLHVESEIFLCAPAHLRHREHRWFFVKKPSTSSVILDLNNLARCRLPQVPRDSARDREN